jgi:hypothetical protein
MGDMGSYPDWGEGLSPGSKMAYECAAAARILPGLVQILALVGVFDRHGSHGPDTPRQGWILYGFISACLVVLRINAAGSHLHLASIQTGARTVVTRTEFQFDRSFAYRDNLSDQVSSLGLDEGDQGLPLRGCGSAIHNHDCFSGCRLLQP